jgi:hypothetical protein
VVERYATTKQSTTKPQFIAALAVSMESFVTNTLTLKDDKKRWYPASIANLEHHLSFLISKNNFFDGEEAHPIRKIFHIPFSTLNF